MSGRAGPRADHADRPARGSRSPVGSRAGAAGTPAPVPPSLAQRVLASPPSQAGATPELLLHTQRTAGNAAARALLSGGARSPALVSVARSAPTVTGSTATQDALPDPRVATWSTDRFEVTFARTGGTLNPRLQLTVRYTGPHSAAFSPTTTASVDIAPKPLAVRVLSVDDTGLSLDLYSDGTKIVRLRDDARLSTLPDRPGRSHVFNLYVDQRNVSSSSVTVLDAAATPADLTVTPKPGNPGANPVVTGIRLGADGWQMLLDGDGDQDKELEVTLALAADGGGSADRVLSVTAVQRSSTEKRTATMPLAAGGGEAFGLMPLVREVTDGHGPTRISLFHGAEPALLIHPGVHGLTGSFYALTLGGSTGRLTFPPEATTRRRIAEAGAAQNVGGIVAVDVSLGAYRDPFRLSFRKFSGGPTTFGLSALNGGVPRDTVGAELSLPGPIRYAPVDTGETSIGVDLDGDGKADLQIYDRLTTPADYDGGGPPAVSRNHEIRVLGHALGTERTFRFHYRYGAMLGVNSLAGAASAQAGRDAEAVGSLAEQAATTTLDDSMDQIEIAMLAMRRRAVDKGVLTPEAFDANLALWQVLVRVRAQVSTSVPSALQAEALKAAEAFQTAMAAEVPGASAVHVAPAALVAALRGARWAGAIAQYGSAVRQLDALLQNRLEKKPGSDKDLEESKHLGRLRSELDEIPAGKVIRVAGTYHPDEKFRSEGGFVSMVPLQLYVWKEGFFWKLKDVTNPSKPYTYSMFASPRDSHPPLDLFTELDDPDHFPSGTINVVVPGGVSGQITVRDRLTWKKFFTYLGLTLAAVGLTLSAVASAGATTAAVPAAWALGASALAGATAAGLDLVEHIQRDNLDARTAVLDLAQIVAGIATAGALAAGRIVVAAGSAPAGARWTGAWAQTAMLAQRSYVPFVASAAGADVVTVAVMTHGLRDQLAAVDKSTADPAEKSRARMLLLVQAASMAGLTALQLKGVGPLGRGETLVLTRGPDGVPMASPALRPDTLIIDANVAIALDKRRRWAQVAPGQPPPPGLKPMQSGELALLKRYDAMNPGDVRVADTVVGETTARGGAVPQRGFAVGVDRAGAEYQEVLGELTRANVGAGKGAADREIVADAFFGVGEPGVVATFATMDPNVYKKLYALKVAHEGATPLTQLVGQHQVKGKPPPGLPEIFPAGFSVTLNTSTRPALNVVPMPNK